MGDFWRFYMEIIKKTLSGLQVGEVLTHQNMTVMPLVCNHVGIVDYLTLDEALFEKCVRIKELSEEGSVPQLLLVNDGSKPVLLLDGEELIGAKQNRLVNLTILAPARSSITIPVSCVESGRWHHITEHFNTSDAVSFADMRARKTVQVSASLRGSNSRHADQAAVWNHISEKAHCMRAASPTEAMSEIFRRHGGLLSDFVDAFSVVENQVGAIFAINDNIIGFDFFDAASTLEKTFPKLIKSYAIDAIEKQNYSSVYKKSVNKITIEEAEKFLQQVADSEFESYPAVGLGEDVRFSIKGLCGGGLINDERVIHLCAFKINSSDNRGRRNRSDEDTDITDVVSLLRRRAG